MKQLFYFIFFVLFSIKVLPSFAGTPNSSKPFPVITLQDKNDTIVLRSGTEIQGQVVEVKDDKIMYRQGEDSPIAYIKTSEVAILKRSNGKIQVFNEGKKELSVNEKDRLISKKDNCNNAIKDVQNRYQPGAGFVTGLITALFGGLLGLIPAAIYASSIPNDNNTGLSQDADSDYKDCYREEARKMRKRSAWTGYWVGFVIAVILVIVIRLA